MALYWELYRIDGLRPDDPRVAPLSADFARAPPALIHTAEYDPMRDEGALWLGRSRARASRFAIARTQA